MKMSPELFAELEVAVAPLVANFSTRNYSPMRNRWDALWQSGFSFKRLYDAGLNDNHIDTALRRIFDSESRQ